MAAGRQPRGARKKLSRAGRAWACQVLGRLDPETVESGAIHPDAYEAMAFFGFDVPEDAAAAVDAGERCEVRSDCYEAAVVFAACATQWRWVSVGGGLGPGALIRTGLDYTAVAAVMTAEGIKASLADIAIIETAALGVFAEDRN